jgi:hypothetical protein
VQVPFVQLREMLASNKELAQRLDELERKLATHDEAITGILMAIRELMSPPDAQETTDRVCLSRREEVKRRGQAFRRRGCGFRFRARSRRRIT